MFKKLILITTFLLFGKVHANEHEIPEQSAVFQALETRHIYDSVNVITGEYCECQTDLKTGNKLSIKRAHHSKDSSAMGWHFNLPIITEHEDISLPSNLTIYEFDEKNRLTHVKLNQKWIHINYQNMREFSIKDSEGKEITYHLHDSQESRNGNPHLIEKISYSDGRKLFYEYIDHPTERRKLISKRGNASGNYVINEYYGPNADHHLDRDPTLGSVKLQKAPVGKDETPITTNQFYYHLGFTEVIDALGNKTIYRHNKNKKLTAIESFLESELYRIEKFTWENNQLLCKSLEDASGNKIQSEHYRYDSWGNIVEHKLVGNLTATGKYDEIYKTIYRYSNDDLHNLVYHLSDNGFAVRYNYVEKTRLLSSKLTYDQGKLKKREFYTYDANGKLIEGMCDDGVTLDKDNLKGITERRISRLTPHREHDSPEVIEESTLDLKDHSEQLLKRTVLVYSQEGKVIQQRIHDSCGNFQFGLDFEYDSAGRLIRSKDIQNNKEEYSYDIEGRLILYKDSKKEIHQTYDLVDRLKRKLVKELDKPDVITSYEYDYNGNCITTRDLFNNEMFHKYDSLGREVETIFCDGTSVSNGYDLNDRIIVTTDSNGYSTHTKYNTRGKPSSVHYPDGTTESYEYYIDGSLYKSVGKNGSYTTYIRDFLARPTEINFFSKNHELISSTKNTYTTFHLTSTTNPNGLKTDYHYDNAGRLIEKSNAFRRIEYFYDTLGELKSQKEWLGDEYAWIINKKNEQNQLTEIRIEDCTNLPLKKVEIPKIINQAYDEYSYENTLVREITDDKGYKVQIHYDAMGRESIIEQRDPFGQMIAKQSNTYDAASNLIYQTYSAYIGGKTTYDQTTAYIYGPCNRLESVTEAYGSPEQQTTHYNYNSAGQLEILSKSDGSYLRYTYEDSGAVAEIYASDQSLHYRYQYDAMGNANLIINLIDNTFTKRKYNQFNQLIEETLANGCTLNFTYDSRGRRTSITLPDYSKTHYKYDSAYLKTISRVSKDGSVLYDHHYEEYDLSGRSLQQSLVGCLGNINFTYDESGKLISQAGNYYEEQIQYNSNQLPESISTISQNESSINNYIYDTLNQLTSESGNYNNTYEYDSIRNRISKNEKKYSVNLQNELLACENNSYTYDSNGNMIERNNSKLYYDALNRLTRVIHKDFKITYTYDPFGRRITKTLKKNNETKSVKYIYEQENEIGCLDDLGNLLEYRVLGIGKGGEIGAAVTIEIEDRVFIPIHDSRGSTRLLIDATNGSVSGNYSFSAYGEEKISGDVVSPWRYSGKRIDDETGLVFFGKRYYDPVIGRWLTKDPLGTPEGPNRYAYALNNPMSNIDEYGLYSFSDLIHSFWKGVQTLGSYSLHSFDTFKYNVSFIDYIRPHFDKVAQDIVGRTPLHLAGFYQDASECGVHGKGELHDKVRITLMNGILNARIDYKNTINFISDCHGGINVHYIFDATEGWSWDIFKAIAAKFGYVSPQAHMLADTWKAMIDEMGGVDGGGLIMHFAHSVGGTHTQAALSLLTPEELKMIRITTFGSATLVDYPGVESITNFISKRDGVPYLDPIKYVQALLGLNNNTLFVGSWLGIPFIDHTLGSSTYYLLIELLGQRFLDDYHLQ